MSSEIARREQEFWAWADVVDEIRRNVEAFRVEKLRPLVALEAHIEEHVEDLRAKMEASPSREEALQHFDQWWTRRQELEDVAARRQEVQQEMAEFAARLKREARESWEEEHRGDQA